MWVDIFTGILQINTIIDQNEIWTFKAVINESICELGAYSIDTHIEKKQQLNFNMTKFIVFTSNKNYFKQ